MRLLIVLLAALAASCSPAAAPPAASPASPTNASPTTGAPVTGAVRIDVWHDTVCPWCRIGLHNLEAALDGVDRSRVQVVHHPFLLEPDAPPEGVGLRERLGAKYGADKLDAMFARVSEAGARSGVTFRWDKVSISPNTVASHALIEHAPADQRPAVLAGLHKAHFEDGRNIGDVEVLVDIAQASGLNASAARAAITDPARLAAVRAAAVDASRRGIRGVPYIDVEGRALKGAQSPDAIRATIMAALQAQ